MIYILEGTNGVGKSQVAQAIQARLPDAPLWRPFRDSPERHWGHNDGETGTMLKSWGVPLNSFIDDLYVADALRTLRPSRPIILDRSMPSGVAYGTLDNEAWTQSSVDDVWGYWLSMMADAGPVVWIHLKAPYNVTKSRCSGRWHPNKKQWELLTRTYDRLIARTSGKLPIHVIHTHDKTPEAIAERLCQA